MSSSELKFLLDLIGKLVAVGLAGSSCHTDSAEGVYSSFKGTVGLKSDDKLLILIEVAGGIARQRGYGYGIDVEDTAEPSL